MQKPWPQEGMTVASADGTSTKQVPQVRAPAGGGRGGGASPSAPSASRGSTPAARSVRSSPASAKLANSASKFWR